jgi:hypothetical protein
MEAGEPGIGESEGGAAEAIAAVATTGSWDNERDLDRVTGGDMVVASMGRIFDPFYRFSLNALFSSGFDVGSRLKLQIVSKTVGQKEK